MGLRAAAIAATACAAIGGAYVAGRVHGTPSAPVATGPAPATAVQAAVPPSGTAPAAPETSLTAAGHAPSLVEPIWGEGTVGIAPTSFADAPPATADAPAAADAAPSDTPPTDDATAQIPPPPPAPPAAPPPVTDDHAWAPAETNYVIVREYYGYPQSEAVVVPQYCRSYGIGDDDAYCLLQIARCANRPFIVVCDDWRGRCRNDYNVLLVGYGLTPEIFIVDPGPAVWWPSVYDRPFACWRRHSWAGVALTAHEFHALVSYRIAVEYQGLPPDRFFVACRTAPAPIAVIYTDRDRCGAGGRDWHGEALRVHSERPWRMPEPDRIAWRTGSVEQQRAQATRLAPHVAHLPPPPVRYAAAPTGGSSAASTGVVHGANAPGGRPVEPTASRIATGVHQPAPTNGATAAHPPAQPRNPPVDARTPFASGNAAGAPSATTAQPAHDDAGHRYEPVRTVDDPRAGRVAVGVGHPAPHAAPPDAGGHASSAADASAPETATRPTPPPAVGHAQPTSPAPRVEHVDPPADVRAGLVPHNEQPASRIESPAARIETPAARVESPAARTETPAARIESPAARVPTIERSEPAARVEASARTESTPHVESARTEPARTAPSATVGHVDAGRAIEHATPTTPSASRVERHADLGTPASARGATGRDDDGTADGAHGGSDGGHGASVGHGGR